MRYGWIIRTLSKNRIGCFVTGPPISGKTTLMKQTAKQIRKYDAIMTTHLPLSSASEPDQVQLNIEKKLEKRRKNILGGPSGKPLLILVDDSHLPQ